MMEQPTKKHKVEETSNNCKEAVLFNSDTLTKIISYLPSIDVLNLALTCKRFGVSNTDEQSVIKKSAQILVQEIATEEQLAALPHYEGESSLADYHYLQSMKEPLTFDKLTGEAEYVNDEDKSCVRHSNPDGWHGSWATAFSNNIMRAGKHYASFQLCSIINFCFVGVMRPGQANQDAIGIPFYAKFYNNFSRNTRQEERHNNIQCCMYVTHTGDYAIGSWEDRREYTHRIDKWEEMETMSSRDEVGMLLDLDEGTFSVYKNDRKLGVMKKGLAGCYCWVASLHSGMKVTMRRGVIPPVEM